MKFFETTDVPPELKRLGVIPGRRPHNAMRLDHVFAAIGTQLELVEGLQPDEYGWFVHATSNDGKKVRVDVRVTIKEAKVDEGTPSAS